MEINWFVREFNGRNKARATKRRVLAVFDEQGWNLGDFGEDEFDFLEAHYLSHEHFVAVPQSEDSTKRKPLPTNQKSPFTSVWYRSSVCELRQYDPGKYVKALARPPFWIFVFSGEVEEYKPNSQTLEDAINLSVPDDSFQKPNENTRAFFERWGPLGFYHLIAPPHLTSSGKGPNYFEFPYPAPFTHIQYGSLLDFPKKMKATDLWRQFHLSQIQDQYTTQYMIPRNKYFFADYFEYGFMALAELRLLQYVWKLKERNSFILLNNYLNEGIREVVDTDECGPYKGIEYRSLRDALYGLIALEIDSKRPWLICANEQCRREFIREKDPRQKYCHDRCRLQQADRNRRRREAEKGRPKK